MRRTTMSPYTASHGIVYFLFLIAYAMVQITSFYVLLPLFSLAILALVLPTLPHTTSYLDVALTVSKNE